MDVQYSRRFSATGDEMGEFAVALMTLALMLFQRPWRSPDQATRDYAALAAAILVGILLTAICSV